MLCVLEAKNSLAHTQEEGNQTPPLEESCIKELVDRFKTTINYIKGVIRIIPLKFLFHAGAEIAMFLWYNQFVFIL